MKKPKDAKLEEAMYLLREICEKAMEMNSRLGWASDFKELALAG